MSETTPLQTDDYLAPATLARLGAFELRARMIVEGIRSGMHASPYYGFSVEFAQHRQYVQGDDIRHLDWKVFGRSDKLYLKQYEQETNLDVVLLVDSSGSMGFGTLTAEDASEGSAPARQQAGKPVALKRTWRKFDHATALGAAMSFLALQQQDRVGMVVFADGVRSLVNRSSARGHWRQIVAALNTHPVQAATSIGRCVDQALGKVTNRVLFVIISDFFDDLDQIRSAMARVRHRGHDLILLQTLDRQEMRFDFRTPAPFEGMELEGKLNLDPRSLRRAYLEILSAHCKSLEKLARGFGFDYQRIDTHDAIGPVLSHFLARRMAQGRRGRG